MDVPAPPLTAKMTFVAPLEECGADYGGNLLRDIAALFNEAEIDMNEVNFVRDGQMMMRFELDIICWK